MKQPYLSILFIVLFSFSAFTQNEVTDSLEKVLPNLKGAERVNVLNELCWQLGPTNIEKAEQYGLEALEIASRLNDSLLLAQVYNDLGTVYYRKSDYDSALVLYFNALRIRENANRPDLAAAVNNKIGATYLEQSQFKPAVEYQMKALRYFESVGDSIKMSQCLTNLGRVYYENHEYDKSNEYHKRALQIFEKYNYTYGLATTYGSMALNYQFSGDDNGAVEYFEKALENFRAINDKGNIATVLLDLGQLYRKMGDQEKGKQLYEESIAISKSISDQHTQAMAMANLANILEDEKQYKRAEELYLEALKIAKDKGILKVLHQCYRELAHLYSETGNYKKAFEFKSDQYTIHDSIYNVEKYEQFADLQTRYETEKKEQQITLLEAQNDLKNSRIQRQRNLILFVVIGVVLLVIISMLGYNRKRLQHKAQVEEERNLYRKKLLEASVEAEEKERKRIARELHDGVAQQLTGLKMAWQVLSKDIKVEPEKQQKLGDITKTLDQTADEVRNLSHQMMPRVLSESGLIPALEDMLAKSLKYSNIAYEFEHFGIDSRFHENVELSLYRICQELINNIIKHSGASKVTVQLLKSKDNLVMLVEDNGKGFAGSGEKKEGIGLMNIASRIDTVNGEINYEPSPGSGTVARIRIPLGAQKQKPEIIMQ
ncbi:MAG TPA: tetratricopeptide repeat protein [Bacteroidales bacterium]|nr:tetratricopeptide repeat protein [Bacteroidales bacterium]